VTVLELLKKESQLARIKKTAEIKMTDFFIFGDFGCVKMEFVFSWDWLPCKKPDLADY